MKILYLKINMFNERCGGRGNTKEQCSCISNVVSSKKMVGKVTQKQCEKH